MFSFMTNNRAADFKLFLLKVDKNYSLIPIHNYMCQDFLIKCFS